MDLLNENLESDFLHSIIQRHTYYDNDCEDLFSMLNANWKFVWFSTNSLKYSIMDMENRMQSNSSFLDKMSVATKYNGTVTSSTIVGSQENISTTTGDTLLNLTILKDTLVELSSNVSATKPIRHELPLCADMLNAGTTGTPSEYVGSDESALLYIVIVLGFYAFAMVVMMVAYVRRENQEAEISNYFTEFIKRDRFETARYQNRQKIESVQRTLKTLYKPIIIKETGVWISYNA